MIVTTSTVKDTLPNVERFVRRNLAGGVDHLVVFLDAEQPDVAEFLDSHPHATCVRADPCSWLRSRPAALNQRQRRNASAAVRLLARFDWAEWVFHVDADEVVHVDSSVLQALPPQVRAVQLSPREAAVQSGSADDPTWFKRLLGPDELALLAVLGIIDREHNRSYFRAQIGGKVGVRPEPGIRVGLHRASGADGTPLMAHTDDALVLLHYESTDFVSFVRKWSALVSSGPWIGQTTERAATCRAVRALMTSGLSTDVTEPLLRRIFERTVVDDVETLRNLGLLEQWDPDTWTRQPERLPRGAATAWSDAIEGLCAARRDSRPSEHAGVG